MIRHGAHYLADSIPILRYLEDHFANRPLLPQDAGERKTVMKRVWWLDGNVMINAGRLYYGYKPQHIKSASDALGLALEFDFTERLAGYLSPLHLGTGA